MPEEEVRVDDSLQLRARVAELEYENAMIQLRLDEEDSRKPAPSNSGSIDPYVAGEIVELRQRLCQAESTIVTLKENSTTTSFTSEGPLGQRLLEKCRRLMKENDRLGEALVTSRISQLEQGGHYLHEREAVLINQIKSLLGYNMTIEAKLAERDREISKLKGLLNVSHRSQYFCVQDLQQENAEHRSRERRRGR